VDEQTYLSCPDPRNCSSIHMVTATGLGYRDVETTNTDMIGGTYAYMMSGNLFGSGDAFVGMVSYINTGDRPVALPTNRIYSASPKNSEPVVRVGRNHAPEGPVDVCVGDVVDGVCVESPGLEGGMKFSIYAKVFSDTFGSQMRGTSGLGNLTHVAVRTRLSLVHGDDSPRRVEASEITFNGGMFDLDTLGNVAVEDMSVIIGEHWYNQHVMNVVFPQTYNYGNFSDESTQRVEGRGVVMIKASADPNGGIFIDYIFDRAFWSGEYLIYDPIIKFFKKAVTRVVKWVQNDVVPAVKGLVDTVVNTAGKLACLTAKGIVDVIFTVFREMTARLIEPIISVSCKAIQELILKKLQAAGEVCIAPKCGIPGLNENKFKKLPQLTKSRTVCEPPPPPPPPPASNATDNGTANGSANISASNSTDDISCKEVEVLSVSTDVRLKACAQVEDVGIACDQLGSWLAKTANEWMYDHVVSPAKKAIDSFLGCKRDRRLEEQPRTVVFETAIAAVEEVSGGHGRFASEVEGASPEEVARRMSELAIRASVRGQEMLQERLADELLLEVERRRRRMHEKRAAPKEREGAPEKDKAVLEQVQDHTFPSAERRRRYLNEICEAGPQIVCSPDKICVGYSKTDDDIYCYGSNTECLWNSKSRSPNKGGHPIDCETSADCSKYNELSPQYTDDGRQTCPETPSGNKYTNVLVDPSGKQVTTTQYGWPGDACVSKRRRTSSLAMRLRARRLNQACKMELIFCLSEGRYEEVQTPTCMPADPSQGPSAIAKGGSPIRFGDRVTVVGDDGEALWLDHRPFAIGHYGVTEWKPCGTHGYDKGAYRALDAGISTLSQCANFIMAKCRAYVGCVSYSPAATSDSKVVGDCSWYSKPYCSSQPDSTSKPYYDQFVSVATVPGIYVLSATYGGNHGAAKDNQLKNLAAACLGKWTCEYKIDHQRPEVGDPVPGFFKDYKYSWNCDDGNKYEGSVCSSREDLQCEASGETITLTCPDTGTGGSYSGNRNDQSGTVQLTSSLPVTLQRGQAPTMVRLDSGAWWIGDAGTLTPKLTPVQAGVAGRGEPEEKGGVLVTPGNDDLEAIGSLEGNGGLMGFGSVTLKFLFHASAGVKAKAAYALDETQEYDLLALPNKDGTPAKPFEQKLDVDVPIVPALLSTGFAVSFKMNLPLSVRASFSASATATAWAWYEKSYTVKVGSSIPEDIASSKGDLGPGSNFTTSGELIATLSVSLGVRLAIDIRLSMTLAATVTVFAEAGVRWEAMVGADAAACVGAVYDSTGGASFQCRALDTYLTQYIEYTVSDIVTASKDRARRGALASVQYGYWYYVTMPQIILSAGISYPGDSLVAQCTDFNNQVTWSSKFGKKDDWPGKEHPFGWYIIRGSEARSAKLEIVA